ncbi:hypothetical protein [Stutzerimonas nitrititolerans]|uniref:hypothetical protein n=1 Tax=Stutzerimonas nitrititolerans TaxID=2482751 RepID=UPI00289C64A5|nr:hypothetical protein [Stutzerimonas nitrititolerans]
MSEKESSEEKSIKPLPLDIDDVIRFFESVTPDRICGHCDSASFVINADPNSKKHARLYAIPVFREKNKTAPVIIVRCDNCGAVYQHGYGHIKRWIDENPIEKFSDPEGDVEHSDREDD